MKPTAMLAKRWNSISSGHGSFPDASISVERSDVKRISVTCNSMSSDNPGPEISTYLRRETI